MGVLQQLNGLLVGRPFGYSEAWKAELRSVILERTRDYTFPIVVDVDFGHTSPQCTLPIGCRAAIDSGARRLDIFESAVEE
jgi:muramoyltetrapeptide carboxypeptidase LdcA involved in peptidoglycan recycling